MLTVAIDTETTGSDFWHGAKPYFVTICDQTGHTKFIPWEVDPETRGVDAWEEDLQVIDDEVRRADVIVGQNWKFDLHALGTVWSPFRQEGYFDWSKVQDTLVASHLLSSNTPHDLTSLAFRYLGDEAVEMEKLEKNLEKATQEARRWCRSHLPSWAIAKKGREDMPSAKEKTWKIDAWLPMTLRRLENHGPEEWDTVLAEYANADSAVTVALWGVMEAELHRLDLWELYLEGMKVSRVIWGMEERDVIAHRGRLAEMRAEYREESAKAAKVMVEIAAAEGFDLSLPKSGNNGSLKRFCFGFAEMSCDVCKSRLPVDRGRVPGLKKVEAEGRTCVNCRTKGIGTPGKPKVNDYPCLNLPVIATTDTGAPSLDKDALDEYVLTLPPDSEQLRFVEALWAFRKRGTSLGYMDSYEKFWLPTEHGEDWMALHPSLNQTGTKHLRMSMQNPNAQQVSKLPDNRGLTLRRIFGPAPWREWWVADFENVELKLPAFECDEQQLMDIFLHPKDPPYFGSYHLVIFDTLHPELFRKHGVKVKELFNATWYQWVKNGNFARQYGCQEKKADLTYRVPGAYKKIGQRFPKIDALNRKYIAQANRQGYVETLRDRSIDARRGYPIMTSRSERGEVLPTVPFCYHVSGSAMWGTRKAMVRCDDELREWRHNGFDAWMALQVHDELCFDFPFGGKRNLPRARKLVKLMEQSGEDFGIPLTASLKYCPNDWSRAEEPR